MSQVYVHAILICLLHAFETVQVHAMLCLDESLIQLITKSATSVLRSLRANVHITTCCSTYHCYLEVISLQSVFGSNTPLSYFYSRAMILFISLASLYFSANCINAA
jgi:hypothetical protein